MKRKKTEKDHLKELSQLVKRLRAAIKRGKQQKEVREALDELSQRLFEHATKPNKHQRDRDRHSARK